MRVYLLASSNMAEKSPTSMGFFGKPAMFDFR
jgi:hypothetical protein